MMIASFDRFRVGGNTLGIPSQVSDGICATSAITYGMGCRLPLIKATIAILLNKVDIMELSNELPFIIGWVLGMSITTIAVAILRR